MFVVKVASLCIIAHFHCRTWTRIRTQDLDSCTMQILWEITDRNPRVLKPVVTMETGLLILTKTINNTACWPLSGVKSKFLLWLISIAGLGFRFGLGHRFLYYADTMGKDSRAVETHHPAVEISINQCSWSHRKGPVIFISYVVHD